MYCLYFCILDFEIGGEIITFVDLKRERKIIGNYSFQLYFLLVVSHLG